MMSRVKSSLLIVAGALLASLFISQVAQADLENPAMSVGYANVFDSSAPGDCGGGFCFGSGWDVADLKATVAGEAVVLQPNFNTYNAADPYWANGAVGNKIFEANLFDEIGTVPSGTGTYTFSGYVDSNTLDAGYTAQAFIKVLDTTAGFIDALGDAARGGLTPGQFSVTADLSAFEGDATKILQIGFVVTGLNANPADEAALGSIELRIGASSGMGGGAGGAGPEGIPVLPFWALFGLAGLVGLLGLRHKR